AAHVLAHISLPNGQLPQIGDAARGKVRRGFSDVTDFVASGGLIGKPPEAKAVVLKRGYVSSRSGWGEMRPLHEESHAVIRFGKDLRAHSHQDRGSVHIYSAGQAWLVDSGFHSYNSSAPVNRYLKSRESHNVASIMSFKHNDDAPVELVAHEINAQYHDFTLIDRGYEDIDLTRRVLYLIDPDCWIVSDQAVTDAR